MTSRYDVCFSAGLFGEFSTAVAKRGQFEVAPVKENSATRRASSINFEWAKSPDRNQFVSTTEGCLYVNIALFFGRTALRLKSLSADFLFTESPELAAF